MERKKHNEDFEQFLQTNANQYKMYPSDKVWEGIHSKLHPGRKRLIISTILLFMLAGSFTAYYYISNTKENTAITSGNAIKPDLNYENNEGTGVINTTKTRNNNFNTGVSSKSNTLTANPGTVNSFIVKEVSLSENKLPASAFDNNLPKQILQGREIESLILQAKTNAALYPLFDNAGLIQQRVKNINRFTAILPKVDNNPIAINKPRRKSNLIYQFHFAPTISYRKLTENKSFLNSPLAQSTSLRYTALSDVNNVVTHKPQMGLEFGLDIKKPLSRRINGKIGVQFNINRYEINAYSSPTSEIATIALNSGYTGFEQLSVRTNYRNFSGSSQDWLQNFYFQVGVPIGGELVLANKDNVKFGVSGSVQPTYLLGKRAYVISSDYKNYVEVPSLVRRANVNVDFETFLGWSSGKLNMQFGPQVRYQTLSSYVKKYPVKEHLFDFGFKLAISPNK